MEFLIGTSDPYVCNIIISIMTFVPFLASPLTSGQHVCLQKACNYPVSDQPGLILAVKYLQMPLIMILPESKVEQTSIFIKMSVYGKNRHALGTFWRSCRETLFALAEAAATSIHSSACIENIHV
jgi:hypothetical protein